MYVCCYYVCVLSVDFTSQKKVDDGWINFPSNRNSFSLKRICGAGVTVTILWECAQARVAATWEYKCHTFIVIDRCFLLCQRIPSPDPIMWLPLLPNLTKCKLSVLSMFVPPPSQFPHF
uniref:Uncharacterized protein n=1 Tax=Anguilla anguilla TaxID=7936 RepID=A0A0E9WIX7_ANGAN